MEQQEMQHVNMEKQGTEGKKMWSCDMWMDLTSALNMKFILYA